MPHCIECMLVYVPVSNYFQSQAPSRSFCGIVHCPDCKSYSEDQTRNTTNLHSVSWQLYWLKCNIVIHHIHTSSFSHCRHWALPDFTGSTSHQCLQLYAVVPISPTSTPQISFSKCQSISWEKWWHIFHPTLGEAAFQATPLSKKKQLPWSCQLLPHLSAFPSIHFWSCPTLLLPPATKLAGVLCMRVATSSFGSCHRLHTTVVTRVWPRRVAAKYEACLRALHCSILQIFVNFLFIKS